MANEVQKFEGEQVKNPYAMATEAAKAQGQGTAMTQAESQRAMIEVMTGFEVARRFPRDPALAMSAILAECNRPSLAEVAIYEFARGGSKISGPSIRLLEAVARHWCHIQAGFRVLERRNGSSSIQAYARDLQSNTLVERVFDVKHWRDTKQGGYMLKDERDIYELEANMAQRRVRACMEGLIPGDVMDAAIAQCELASKTNVDISPEGLKKMLNAFAPFGVNKAMIEARIQCKLEAIKPVQAVTLRKQFMSLKDGMATAEDFFDVSLADKKASTEEEKPKQPDLAAEVKKEKAKKEKEAQTAAKNKAPLKEDGKEVPAAEVTPSDATAPLTMAQKIAAELKAAPDLDTLNEIFDKKYAPELDEMSPAEWNGVRNVWAQRSTELGRPEK